MALRKELQSPHGATASYWVVSAIAVDFEGRASKEQVTKGVGAISLLGFVSEAARREGRPPLDRRQLTVTGDRFEALARDSSKRGAYLLARSTPGDFYLAATDEHEALPG